MKFPSSRNCQEVEKLFEKNEENYLKFANIDKQPTLDKHGLGIY